MLTSAILKVDIVCDITMTSIPNSLNNSLNNQRIDNTCCYSFFYCGKPCLVCKSKTSQPTFESTLILSSELPLWLIAHFVPLSHACLSRHVHCVVHHYLQIRIVKIQKNWDTLSKWWGCSLQIWTSRPRRQRSLTWGTVTMACNSKVTDQIWP